MVHQGTYFTDPGPDKQLVLTTKSGRKFYKHVAPELDSADSSLAAPTFAEPQGRVEKLKAQLDFLKKLTINGSDRLTILINDLEEELDEADAAEDTFYAAEEFFVKQPPAAEVDSGYTSDVAITTNDKPSISTGSLEGQSTNLANDAVPFTLHINITLNNDPVLQYTHFSLDASKLLSLEDMLALVESLYRPRIPDSYHSFDLNLSPGTISSSPLNLKSLCRGILSLGESYNRAADTFARSRMLLSESADYNREKYKKWYWRNITRGIVPKRKGWTPRYTWDGDELEVSFSMHLKQEAKKIVDAMEEVDRGVSARVGGY